LEHKSEGKKKEGNLQSGARSVENGSSSKKGGPKKREEKKNPLRAKGIGKARPAKEKKRIFFLKG